MVLMFYLHASFMRWASEYVGPAATPKPRFGKRSVRLESVVTFHRVAVVNNVQTALENNDSVQIKIYMSSFLSRSPISCFFWFFVFKMVHNISVVHFHVLQFQRPCLVASVMQSTMLCVQKIFLMHLTLFVR